MVLILGCGKKKSFLSKWWWPATLFDAMHFAIIWLLNRLRVISVLITICLSGKLRRGIGFTNYSFADIVLQFITWFYFSNRNQIFNHTCWIAPKRVASSRGSFPRLCAWATQLLTKKCRSGGEPLATLWIEPQTTRSRVATNWFKPQTPGSETNALPLNQLSIQNIAFNC